MASKSNAAQFAELESKLGKALARISELEAAEPPAPAELVDEVAEQAHVEMRLAASRAAETSRRNYANLDAKLADIAHEFRASLEGALSRVSEIEASMRSVEVGVGGLKRAMTREEVLAVIETDPCASFDVMAQWKATFSSQRFERGQTVRADQVGHLGDLAGSGLKLVLSDPDHEDHMAVLRGKAAQDVAARHKRGLAERAERERAKADLTAASAEAVKPVLPAKGSKALPKIVEGPGLGLKVDGTTAAPSLPHIAEGPGAKGKPAPAMPSIAEGPGKSSPPAPKSAKAPALPPITEGPGAGTPR